MRRKLLVVAMSVLCTCAHAAVTEDIKALIEQGKPKEAYDLGKQSPQMLGDGAFDFFFGIAAIDGGAPGEGVLALERFLLQFPDNRSARFHIARGYYVLGEDQRAHGEFSDLLAEADEGEKIVIGKFLDAIRARESRYLPTAAFFLEAGAGYDSNINAGVRPGSVAGLPGFNVTASGVSAKEGDWFRTLAAGAQGTLPVAPGVMLYGGAQANGRWHGSSSNDIFDQSGGQLQGGVTVLDGRNLYRAGVDYTLLNVNGSQYLQVPSLVGEWVRQFDQFNRFAVGAQFSQLRYENHDIFLNKEKTLKGPSGAAQRDSDFSTLYASWTHTLAHAWNPVFTLTASLGNEHNVKNRAEYSRDVLGLRGQVSVQPMPKWSFGGALTYQNSTFKDYFGGTSSFPKRKDDYFALELSALYAIDRNWSIRAEATFVDQKSNVGLYEYNRNLAGLKLRYDFK